MRGVKDDLHTGNSAIENTFGNEQPSQTTEEAVSEQQRELAELLPGVDYIKQSLEAEIAGIADIRSYIKDLGEKADWMTIQSEYRARELYIAYLTGLKMSIDDKVLTAKEAAQ